MSIYENGVSCVKNERMYLDRSTLKDWAKASLRGNYWKAFLVALVLALAGGGNGLNLNNFNSTSPPETTNRDSLQTEGGILGLTHSLTNMLG